MYTINYICTRPDTNIPFYHDSAEAAEAIAALESIRSSFDGLVYTNNVSQDGLTYTASYVYDSKDLNDQFMQDFYSQYPTFIVDRNAYYSSNNHTLNMEVINA